jgi:broad specificity phosphatase PhoE
VESAQNRNHDRRLRRPAFERLVRETSFYFVRHGESEGNASGIVQGQLDLPLSESGYRHARAAGEWLADKGIRRMYSSPLRRCTQTAAAIGEVTGVGLAGTDPELTELGTGVFSGLTFSQFAQQYPQAYKRFRVESWEAVPEAESTTELYERSLTQWERLIDRANLHGGPLLSVTHVGILQWLIKATIGCPAQVWMPIFKAANCGIFELSARPARYDEPAAANTAARDEAASGKDPEPADGFFAEWRTVNLIPYRE